MGSIYRRKTGCWIFGDEILRVRKVRGLEDMKTFSNDQFQRHANRTIGGVYHSHFIKTNE